ncbi:hypothetical protein QQS21_006404 [Conoideocrella luteorostrata]|uniref:Uncharacterized protein n=1 Tax=Conoideocrella luteorostrata TaxID=1105319 RepID=A0AAJ0FSZ7_9HYPO|nr:hypothetical protein QQS21_006404 [Conoideocrella luteorostrata]
MAPPTAFTAINQPSPTGRHPGGVHKHSMAQKHTRVVRPDGAYWADLDKDSILQPLNALGIANTNAPNRYAVQKGRIVPQRHFGDVVLPSQDLHASVRPEIVPPRRSSRRLQQKGPRKSNPAWRPTSSVYSHSDGELSPPTPQYKLASSSRFGGSAAEPISPPSSPEVEALRDGFTADDVSPIEDDFDHREIQSSRVSSRRDTHHLPSQQRRVSIPKPSRVGPRPNGPVAPPGGVRSAGERAWNQEVHRGRIITPPENGPATHEAPRIEQALGAHTTATSPGNDGMHAPSPSFGQRMRVIGKAKAELIDSRPPWNGASGRSAMIQPVRDDPNVAPLNIPRKSGKRPGRGGRFDAAPQASETSSAGAGRSAMRRLLPLTSKDKTKKSAASLARQSPDQQLRVTEKTYPSPPQSDLPFIEADSRDALPLNLPNQDFASHQPDSIRSSLNAIKRKPPPASAQASPTSNHLFSESSFSDGAAGLGGPADSPSASRSEAAWVPPPSRFSITTYATSNADTPRQSTEEDLPPLPTLPPTAGVMDRSRPVAGGRSRSSGLEEPTVIAMSTPFIPGEEPQRQSVNSHSRGPHNQSASGIQSTDRRASSLSTLKPLPLAPPEMSSTSDPIAQLNAQISSLLHRRINIERSINQMTILMPQDKLLATAEVVRKRGEEKEKVDNLRQELAETQRELHELGLRLYYAQRRQDKNAEYESTTTLWVQRAGE